MEKGIPSEVLKELNIKITEKSENKISVTAVVEKHQVKLPVPSEIRRELEFSKGQKLTVSYDPKTKIISYQL
jgi:bifunctional DNA-binding transcriptional regulator/antitoxin component of YhaV-PrlF toxin-antitoxin module